MKKELPKKYAVHINTTHSLWDKFYSWFTTKHPNTINYGLHHKYWGVNNTGTFACQFENGTYGCEIITPEFWDECVNGVVRKLIGYILIQEYPRGPYLNTIVIPDELGQYIKEKPLEIYSKEEIESYPNIWKPIYDEEIVYNSPPIYEHDNLINLKKTKY